MDFQEMEWDFSFYLGTESYYLLRNAVAFICLICLKHTVDKIENLHDPTCEVLKPQKYIIQSAERFIWGIFITAASTDFVRTQNFEYITAHVCESENRRVSYLETL
jgi:hypothetical protein